MRPSSAQSQSRLHKQVSTMSLKTEFITVRGRTLFLSWAGQSRPTLWTTQAGRSHDLRRKKHTSQSHDLWCAKHTGQITTSAVSIHRSNNDLRTVTHTSQLMTYDVPNTSVKVMSNHLPKQRSNHHSTRCVQRISQIMTYDVPNTPAKSRLLLCQHSGKITVYAVQTYRSNHGLRCANTPVKWWPTHCQTHQSNHDTSSSQSESRSTLCRTHRSKLWPTVCQTHR